MAEIEAAPDAEAFLLNAHKKSLTCRSVFVFHFVFDVLISFFLPLPSSGQRPSSDVCPEDKTELFCAVLCTTVVVL